MTRRRLPHGTRKLSGKLYEKSCGCRYAKIGYYSYYAWRCATHKAEDEERQKQPLTRGDYVLSAVLWILFAVGALPAAFFLFFLFVWAPIRMFLDWIR